MQRREEERRGAKICIGAGSSGTEGGVRRRWEEKEKSVAGPRSETCRDGRVSDGEGGGAELYTEKASQMGRGAGGSQKMQLCPGCRDFRVSVSWTSYHP